MSFSEWKEVKLGDITDILSGYAFKTKDFIDTGIPVIKIKNIIPPIVDINDVQYVSESLYQEKEKYALKFNDILISLTGSNVNQINSAVGKIGKVRLKNTKLLLNQRVGKVYITDEDKCNHEYIYYYLIQNEIRYKLASSAGGSANQANISPAQIKNIKVKLPPLQEQKSIANILSTLDEKIEINNQINKRLEEMAQSIFKHWFVDFEFPNEEGKPYKSSGGKMIESEMGMVPKGWEVQPLFSLAEYINGTSFKKDEISHDKGLPIIKIAELKQGITNSTKYCNYTKDKKYYIKNGDILFSWSGNPQTSIDTFIWNKGIGILNQHIFKVVSPIYDNEFIYLILKYFKIKFMQIASNKQTTGLGHITISDLKRLKIVLPDIRVIDKFFIRWIVKSSATLRVKRSL